VSLSLQQAEALVAHARRQEHASGRAVTLSAVIMAVLRQAGAATFADLCIPGARRPRDLQGLRRLSDLESAVQVYIEGAWLGGFWFDRRDAGYLRCLLLRSGWHLCGFCRWRRLRSGPATSPGVGRG
jgi:hypothetical protein